MGQTSPRQQPLHANANNEERQADLTKCRRRASAAIAMHVAALAAGILAALGIAFMVLLK